MTTPLWQPSDGQLLKSLREQAGLDRAVLARMASMTVQHLKGLEEGEGGEFYSPAIKAQMGRALLARLGHVAPETRDVDSPVPDLPASHPQPLEPGVPHSLPVSRAQLPRASAVGEKAAGEKAASPRVQRTALLAVLAGSVFVVAVLVLTPSRPTSPRQSAAAAPTVPAPAQALVPAPTLTPAAVGAGPGPIDGAGLGQAPGRRRQSGE